MEPRARDVLGAALLTLVLMSLVAVLFLATWLGA
jgi:hypothetical protein